MKISLSKLITSINNSADSFIKLAIDNITDNEFNQIIQLTNSDILKYNLQIIKILYNELMSTGNGKDLLKYKLDELERRFIPELEEVDEDSLPADKAILNNFIDRIMANIRTNPLKGDPDLISTESESQVDRLDQEINMLYTSDISSGVDAEDIPLFKGIEKTDPEDLSKEFKSEFDLKEVGKEFGSMHTGALPEKINQSEKAANNLEEAKENLAEETNPKIKNLLLNIIRSLTQEIEYLKLKEKNENEIKETDPGAAPGNPALINQYKENITTAQESINILRKNTYNARRNINTIKLRDKNKIYLQRANESENYFDKLKWLIEYQRSALRLSNASNKRKALRIFDRLSSAYDGIVHNPQYSDEKKHELINAEMNRASEAKELVKEKFLGQVTTGAAEFRHEAYGIAERLADSGVEFMRYGVGGYIKADESYEKLFFSSTMYAHLVQECLDYWEEKIAIKEREVKSLLAAIESSKQIRLSLDQMDALKTSVAKLRKEITGSKDVYRRRIVSDRLKKTADGIIEMINTNTIPSGLNASDIQFVKKVEEYKNNVEIFNMVGEAVKATGNLWKTTIENGAIGFFNLVGKQGTKKNIVGNIEGQASARQAALIDLDNLIELLDQDDVKSVFHPGSAGKDHYNSIVKNSTKLKIMIHTLMQERNINKDVVVLDKPIETIEQEPIATEPAGDWETEMRQNLENQYESGEITKEEYIEEKKSFDQLIKSLKRDEKKKRRIVSSFIPSNVIARMQILKRIIANV